MRHYTSFVDKVNEHNRNYERFKSNPNANKLKAKYIAFNKKYFPQARKAYAKYAKNSLWEHNVDVSLSGRTITLTSAYFASRTFIKEIENMLEQKLIDLRFKKAIYKWYDYDDEYTYYTITSYYDSDL